MSFPGLSRPTRGVGLALLAVAVVAAVIGGVVLATGDGDGDGTQQAAGGSSSDSPETSGSSGGSATSSGGHSSGSSSSTAEGGESSDTGDGSESSGSSTRSDDSADDGDSAGDGDGDSDKSGGHGDGGHSDRVPVRVYNNSTIKDLASDAAEDLRDEGWHVEKVSNYSGGVIPETTAYYRKGTVEKAAAMSVAGEFGIRAKPRFDGIKDAHDGLIVIVAKDYKS